jgi:hypothetical protein
MEVELERHGNEALKMNTFLSGGHRSAYGHGYRLRR